MDGIVTVVGSPVKNVLNEAFKGREPWEIVGMTSTAVLAAVWFYNFIFQDESLLERGKKTAFRLVRRIPAVRDKIERETKALNRSFELDALKRMKGQPFYTDLPSRGIDSRDIVKQVERNVYLGHYGWEKGKVSGCVYGANQELKKLVTDVYSLASYTNPLHSDVFPGVCKMEAEVVRMTCRLFGGDDSTCGTMTSGGTESILLACKAYRDYAYEVKGIKRPEMVVPITAHAAFDKAAQYFKIRVRTIPVEPETYVVDLKAMKRAITSNTIMLVCSAPNFPYGTMDDVAAISELGLRYDIPVHVDACLGGFLICFMREAGYKLPDFDFKLPGVTSISADTHKYGYAPKGTSVVLYRNKPLLHFQYTIMTEWLGGLYGSTTISGSRAGGLIASCWATLMFHGMEGYVEATRKVIETTKYIEKEMRNMKGIYLFGTPATSVIAFGSHEFHVFRLCEALNARGWSLNTLQFPSAAHICVTLLHTEPGVAEQFVDDVKVETAKLLKDKPKSVEGMYAVYGSSQSITDRNLVGHVTKCFLDAMYYIPLDKAEMEETASAAIANGDSNSVTSTAD